MWLSCGFRVRYISSSALSEEKKMVSQNSGNRIRRQYLCTILITKCDNKYFFNAVNNKCVFNIVM